MSTTQPTQVARPWRATARTIFAALVGFASMWAVIVEAIGLNTEWQWVSASLLVTGAITRVMALPAVESFLSRFFPWLAAEPAGEHRGEAGRTELLLLIAVALTVVVILAAAGLIF